MTKRFQHAPLSFLNPGVSQERHALYSQCIYDMAAGIGLALELVHSSNFNRDASAGSDEGKPPILSEDDTHKLMRFAIAASNLLAERAYDEIEFLNTDFPKEPK